MRNKLLAAAALSLLVMNPLQVRAEGKNGVAAVVNGEEITVKEMRQGYKENPEISEKVNFNDFYAKALDVYVNGELLYQAAVEEGVTNSPAYKREVEIAKEEIARKIYLRQQVDKELTDKNIDKAYKEYSEQF